MAFRTAAALAIFALSCLALQMQPEKLQTLDQAEMIALQSLPDGDLETLDQAEMTASGRSIEELEREYVMHSPLIQSFVDNTFEEKITNMSEEEFRLWSIKGAINKIASAAKTAGAVAKQVGAAASKARWPYKATGYKTSKEEMLNAFLDLRMTQAVYIKNPPGGVATPAEVEALDFFPARFRGKSEIKIVAGEKNRGYMMFVDTPEALYVSFRGTSNMKDAAADFKSSVLGIFSGVRALAGAGFGWHYAGLSKAMGGAGSLERYALEKSGNCTKPVVAVGHSLGGALANLFAYQMFKKNGCWNMRLATFGSPRVFGKKSAEEINSWCSKKSDCTRWVNWGDSITTLPLSITGFRHVGSPRYIDYRADGGALGALTGKPKRWTLDEYSMDMAAEPWNPLNHVGDQYCKRMETAAKALFNGLTDPDGEGQCSWKKGTAATDQAQTQKQTQKQKQKQKQKQNIQKQKQKQKQK